MTIDLAFQSFIDQTAAIITTDTFVVLTGTLVAAFAGAYGAQYLAEKNKAQEELVSEIRNVNAAINLSYNICNTMYGFKEQQTKVLRDSFYKKKESLKKSLKAHREGRLPENYVFRFDADYKILTAPSLPISRLVTIVFDKINATGKILGTVNILEQVIHTLNDVILRHNEMPEIIKQNAQDDTERMAHYYFGLETDNGDQDSRYSQCVDAAYGYTDDIIFYCAELCKDLNAYGNKILLKNKIKDIEINNPNFEIARSLGLEPDRKNYEQWLGSFKGPA